VSAQQPTLNAPLFKVGLRDFAWVICLEVLGSREGWEGAGDDFEYQEFFVADPVGPPLHHTDLVVEPFDEA
jgi:hypothetical protein